MVTSFISLKFTPRPATTHRPPLVRQNASERTNNNNKKKASIWVQEIRLRNTNWTCLRAFNNGTLKDTASEEEDVCPVDCVTEFKTDEEFMEILGRAKKRGVLVVVDFYRTSCGSCKYIEHLFKKMCKGAGNDEADVVFLKHNVINEYDEKSEVAERLRIKVVPLFQFYRDGDLLEAFATRDKERIIGAIRKYTSDK